MAVGETGAVLPAAGSKLAARTVNSVNGAALGEERIVERVILAMLNADGTLVDVNENTPAWFQGLLTIVGNQYIGQVGGTTKTIQPTLTVSTSAYAAGDVIGVGGVLTLTGAMRVTDGSGVLHSLSVIDDDNNLAGFHVLLFSQALTGTYTDNLVPNLNAADNAKFLGHVTVAASDYVSIGTGAGTTQCIATKRGLSLAVKAAGGSANLYAMLIATTTPQFATSADLILKFGFLDD